MRYYSNHNSYPALDISKANEKSESVNALLKLRKVRLPPPLNLPLPLPLPLTLPLTRCSSCARWAHPYP